MSHSPSWGWVCYQEWPHEGSCPLWPVWWKHPVWWLRTNGLLGWK